MKRERSAAEESRLAAQLRANLRRRKGAPPPPEPGPPTDDAPRS